MKLLILTISAFFCCTIALQAQTAEEKAKATKDSTEKADMGWKKGGSIGLDLSGMGLFNPKVGSGGNRFGIGGVGSIFINHKDEKSFWNNELGLQLAAQRVQVSVTTGSITTQRRDFVKNLDVLRLNSRYGYSISKSNKFFAAIDGLLQTNVLPTYPGNTLKPINDGDQPTARFLSPLLATLSPGIAYNPIEHLSLFYSPVGIRFIYVADDNIALLNIHGNDPGKNNFLGLGSELKAEYVNKYWKDKVAVNSKIAFFSNYLKEPQNVDVQWNNTIDIAIFKGLSLSLLGELFYDNDVRVQIDRNKNSVFGELVANTPGLTRDELAPAASLTGAFLLKYTRIF